MCSRSSGGRDAAKPIRFARFFQGIAKLFLEALIRLGIAQLLSGFLGAVPLASAAAALTLSAQALGLSGGILIFAAKAIETAAAALAAAGAIAGAGSAGGLKIGKAKGGRIPRRAQASLAHRFAAGRARGGRPPGLHHTDTVPIWAAPGEWVMRAKAVQKYGLPFMAALNNGLVNNKFIQAIAGGELPSVFSGSRRRSTIRRHPAGFAEGGSVGTSATAAQTDEGTIIVTPALVADEQTMDRFLAEGAPSFMRFVRSNATDMRSALGLQRGNVK